MRGRTRIWILAALAMPVAGASLARAQDQAFEIRVRAVYLSPRNASHAYAPLGMPSNALRLNGKWLPDLDVEYFFTPHWSSELVLTYPQSQTVTLRRSVLGSPVALGSFKQFPPMLLLKYDLLPEYRFQPYIGAGLNVTFISDVRLRMPTVGPLQLDHTSVGPAVQAGFDYALGDNWYFNADFKWVMIRTAVTYGGVKITEARFDPYLVGVGIGYRITAL